VDLWKGASATCGGERARFTVELPRCIVEVPRSSREGPHAPRSEGRCVGWARDTHCLEKHFPGTNYNTTHGAPNVVHLSWVPSGQR
jgi:hypothetical protein